MQVLIQVPASRGGGGRGDHLPCKIRGRCQTGSWGSSVNISVEHDHFSPAMPTDTSTTCIPPSRLIPSSNPPTTSTFVREAGAIPKEGISLESWVLLTQADMSPHDYRPCGSLRLQSLQPSKVQLHDPTVPQGARTACFPLVSRAGSRAPQGWVISRRVTDLPLPLAVFLGREITWNHTCLLNIIRSWKPPSQTPADIPASLCAHRSLVDAALKRFVLRCVSVTGGYLSATEQLSRQPKWSLVSPIFFEVITYLCPSLSSWEVGISDSVGMSGGAGDQGHLFF